MPLDFRSLKSIFFDLDNTLIDHSAAEHTAFYRCCEQFELGAGRHELPELLERYRVHNEALWSAYRHGQITTADVRIRRWHAVLDEQFPDTDIQTFANAEELSEYYLAQYDDSSTLMPGAEDVLELCLQRFAFVGLITNGFPDQVRRKLENHHWRETFHTVVISEQVGIAKPHEGIFLHAAAQLDHQVGLTAYVGDNYEIDVVGAKAASWNTVWLRLPGHERDDTTDADLIVDSLHELRNHIDV